MPPLVYIDALSDAMQRIITENEELSEDQLEEVAALAAAMACFAMEQAAQMGFDLDELVAAVEAHMALERASKH